MNEKRFSKLKASEKSAQTVAENINLPYPPP